MTKSNSDLSVVVVRMNFRWNNEKCERLTLVVRYGTMMYCTYSVNQSAFGIPVSTTKDERNDKNAQNIANDVSLIPPKNS